MLVLTVIQRNNGRQIDVMVKENQTIQNLIEVLEECGWMQMDSRALLRSWRLGTYLEGYQTFVEAGVWNGDQIYIEGENDESE